MNSDEHQIDYSTVLKYFEDKASADEVVKTENNMEALLDRIHHSIHYRMNLIVI